MEDIVKAIEKLAEKTWVDYALIVVPIFISLLAVVISITAARKQSIMQNNSFCLELYEKRWDVYESIDKILCSVGRDAKICDADISKFDYASHHARFLFGKDMIDFCEETRKELLQLRTIGKKVERNIDHPGDDPNHSDLCDKEAELILSISNRQQQLKNIVASYISFSEYKIQK